MTFALDPSSLARQRWFRAKQRPIATVTQADHAALDRVDLRVLEVAYADGGAHDHYLMPVVDGREPQDGEGAWTAIVRAIAGNVELRSERGHFSCSRTDAFAELLPSAEQAVDALGERRLRVEQSNTSVVIGERLILKLYRLLEPGDNPDLEVSAFLTDAGFADTPAVAGSMAYAADGEEPAAAAMLQAFVPSTGDAWAAMLHALDDDPRRGIQIAVTLGGVTAAMHAALASRPDHPSFPARAATVAETAAWRASAERQLAQAVTAVGGNAHERLVELAPQVRERFADTFGSASSEARVSRIHGDYHLGQLLARTDGRFSIIDFEGEPARPLAERRLPASPLRDVAGMLRSLDYAARTAANDDPSLDVEGWLTEARTAFVGAYGGIEATHAGLVQAFELEKACYEVRYEASNRPEWLWLPLAAVERLTLNGAG
ncbi:MAG TPA: phosphotransferase [Candidatus Limnocylindrales bacterium]|nr:phosphotransferase [Candidatus Limnocylindrales bacterium]